MKLSIMNPVVTVNNGRLKGKKCQTENNKEFFVFKGIPYAKPPVGDLRFSVPVPPESWEGIRDATQDCNICAQFDKLTQNVIGDEDCLYLNVYTPTLSNNDSGPLPVMVFIHGGGFLFGHGTDDSAHGPDYLIEKNVVVVSFNYRLGIFGFLCLDHKDAPGNMGLRDQVLALKWVQKNIKIFNGDPENVTVFGFSAGGASIEYLILSPMAKGLFHKCIAQSGSSLLPWAHSRKIKALAHKLVQGKAINDDEQLLKHLKGMSAKELVLVSTQAIISNFWRGGIHFGFVPTVETSGQWETFLDENPYDLLSQGKLMKVPYIAGVCSREGLLTLPHAAERLANLCKDKNFIDFLHFDVDNTEKTELQNKLKQIYLESDQTYGGSDAFAIDFFSDVDFFGGGFVSMTLIAKATSPVYFYEFAYDGGLNYLKKKYNINKEGACHGDDGGYLIKSNVLGGPISETDKIVRKRLVEMWTNFARCGDPTPIVNDLITTKWEPIAETGIVFMYIDDKLTMKEEKDLYPTRAKLYKELYAKYPIQS
ncbi:hypothetical protein ACJJTC_014577 [Scirpophaga incertulas]